MTNGIRGVALLFGGVSSEHEISCISAQTFLPVLREAGYEVFPIYISKTGKWYLCGEGIATTAEGEKEALEEEASGAGKVPRVAAVPAGGLAAIENGVLRKLPVDIVVPVLHGLNGEDGTVQGLLEMAGLPYVGCGVLASALCMDKVFTKKAVETLGICQAEYVAATRLEIKEEPEALIGRIEEKLAYPVFVKPSRAGSSVGVSKAHNRAELLAALERAAKEDRRVLVEEFIDGREVECAVLGGAHPEASLVGEILAAADFYDYEAKYANAESKTIVPADLPEDIMEEIRRDALAIFQGTDGWGLSRVDFFVRKSDSKVIFNEINTMPGFTSISMWPMLWKERGLSTPEQVERLLDIGLERNLF